jgi:integrase
LLVEASATPTYLEILIGLMMGLRKGEVYGIKFEDIDFANSFLKVRQQVTYDDQRDGKPRAGSCLNAALRKLSNKIGIPEMAFHDMRHTYASYLADHETALTAIARSLGHHKSTLTGNVYVHPGISETLAMKSMNSFIEDLLSPKNPPKSENAAIDLSSPKSAHFVPKMRIAN